MTEESDQYLAVLKASYNYEPQSDEEIAIKEDQLLFLLQKTDEDWWKVKIKGESQEEESPSGLVPAAYVEPAEHTSVVKALYDYEASAPGELSVKEDDVLLVFDQDDAWLLVQNQAEGAKAGFVPENYVAATTDSGGAEPSALGGIVVPPSPPRPVSTYVDPADRVASAKMTADDIKTWSVSEIDKKGKKKKGTLGVGNGAIFFASDSDKTPVQKWQVIDIEGTSIDKSKHIHIEVGGSASTNLHFNAGSKDTAEAIVTKLQSSKALSTAPRPSVSSQPEVPPTTASPPPAIRNPNDVHKNLKNGASVRFAPTSLVIPRSPSVEEYPEHESEPEPDVQDKSVANYGTPDGIGDEDTADALYDFDADGEDELSVKEGERLVIVERDSDEWWKCRNVHGVEGVVPASYLEVISSGPHGAPSADENDEADRQTEEEQAAEERAEASRLAHEQVEKERVEKERKKQEQASRARAAAASAEADRKRREKEKAAAEAGAERKRQEAKLAEEEAKRVEQAAAENNGHRPSTSKAHGDRPSSGRSADGKRDIPPPEKTRVWHDRSGQFRVEAAFLGFSGGKLRLHKVNGIIIEVPSEKMSTEDMRYVEKVTSKKSGGPTPSRKISDDDVPLALQRKHPQPNPSRSTTPKKGPTIDWFDFFLSAGCDLDDCTRYASSFERDKIDESILPDITDATMRSLGLREGDIIRVTKAIGQRYPKKPETSTQEQSLLGEFKQEEHSDNKKTTSPAPNLFAAGPGGALKPRRGRPQPSKSTAASIVDLNAINSVSNNIQRTTSPQSLSPASTPVQVPPRSSSALALPTSSGFDDDAWTPRPSSTKPLAPTPPVAPARAPSAPPAPAPPPPPAAATVSTPQPSPAPAQPQTGASGLAKTTESDIFEQLSRLSQLRPAVSPAVSSPPAPLLQNSSPIASPPPASYRSGLGMGPSPVPIGQLVQNQQAGLLPPQQNGPRGPYAPVPTNQRLLQPLVPTTTGFNSFVPTRTGNASSQGQPQQSFIPSQVTGFPNNPQPVIQQPTGFPSMGPMLSQPTGVTNGNFGAFGHNPQLQQSQFGGVQTNPTGFNPGFGQSPFNNLALPPVPPLPPSASKDTSPANIFAQMKSGTFASGNDNGSQPQDKYDALRPNPLAAQATGWGNPANGFQGAYPAYR